MMSPVSERVVDASPPEWEGRVVRSLTLEALALLQAGQSGVSPRLDQCDAPSLAMSTYVAEERDSQPAQRDEPAHSRIVSTRGEVSPPTNVTSPTAITENTGSQHLLQLYITMEHGNRQLCQFIHTTWYPYSASTSPVL